MQSELKPIPILSQFQRRPAWITGFSMGRVFSSGFIRLRFNVRDFEALSQDHGRLTSRAPEPGKGYPPAFSFLDA